MLVAREKEKKFILDFVNKNKPCFLAIYGRRRVGKTFLIRETLQDFHTYFEITGLKDASLEDNLVLFTQRFQETFYPSLSLSPFKSWFEAFQALTKEMQQHTTKAPFIFFMDELPWLATPKSKLLQMIDYFWNTKWSQMPQVKLFVCGSAASWMINNIINAKGGLHNRLSGQLRVKPFNLKQTHTFLKHTGCRYTKLETLKLYMGLGGIPYYLEKVDKNISALDNLFKLCIDPNGQLHQEFHRLFQALFDNHQEHINIIKHLAAHHYGLPRQMLIKKLGLVSGGRLTKRLQELEAAGFIQSIPALHKKNSAQFRLIDEYCLFYLKWIQDYQTGNVAEIAATQWSAMAKSPSFYSWCGYSFENLVYKNLDCVVKALETKAPIKQVGTWEYKAPQYKTNAKGSQIDIIIERDDNVSYIGEMKFSTAPFVVNKETSRQMQNKIINYEDQFPHEQTFLILITPLGLKRNAWSEDLIHHVITLDDFWK